MTGMRVRTLVAVAVLLGLTSADTHVLGQGRTISVFFDDFSAEWMRRRPGQATATRYFTGAEQDRLDRQLTPETAEWRRDAVEQARRGLKELAAFDRTRMTDAERVSADVMRWQLQIVVDGEPFSDHDFPLDQFDGANVRIPNLMTVVHPVRTEQDARNYVARLRENRRPCRRSDGRSRATRSQRYPPAAFHPALDDFTDAGFREFARRPESAGRDLRGEDERRSGADACCASAAER